MSIVSGVLLAVPLWLVIAGAIVSPWLSLAGGLVFTAAVFLLLERRAEK